MQHGLVYDYSKCFVHLYAFGPSLFTGKERDSESGLDNFGARYYASQFGRFMSPDWAAKPQHQFRTQSSATHRASISTDTSRTIRLGRLIQMGIASGVGR